MSDDVDEMPAAGDTPEESGSPLTPEDRLTALEQIVVPMFKDWAARDEDPVPPVGSAGAVPVAETTETDNGGPWSWSRIDTERRVALAEELAAFVEYLADRYLQHLSAEAYPLAPRWFENPVAVEILTGVMVAHQAVYSDYRTEPSRELADWHEHILWPALDRMKALRLFPDGRVKPSGRRVDVDREARAFLAGELASKPTPDISTVESVEAAFDVHSAPTGPITLP